MQEANSARVTLRKIQDALEELDALNVGRARRKLMEAYVQAKALLGELERIEHGP